MSRSEKYRSFISKVEIVIAVCLFFLMLISCGLYINIKMNGKSVGLPPLSDVDKQLLLRSAESEKIENEDDLIEPVFIGFKLGKEMKAAFPADGLRRHAESAVYEAASKLFGGESTKMEFGSEQSRNTFVEELKNAEEYLLVTFFGDLPSALFLPCMLNNYSLADYSKSHDVRYLFIVPDNDGNVYGVSVSSDYDIYIMRPVENVSFGKISEKAYDVNGNWSDFKFDETLLVNPVLTSSYEADRYIVSSCVEEMGKDMTSPLVSKLFESFSINSNLVKSFSYGDNSEMHYVEEQNELSVNDSGQVIYHSGDGDGVPLKDYIGAYSSRTENYLFADKIFALKCLVNSFNAESSISYSAVGLDYKKDDGVLKVYFKYITDGCVVTDRAYDAVFHIEHDSLTYAEFYILDCIKTGEKSVLIPQNYANAVLAEDNPDDMRQSVFCPVLSQVDDGSGSMRVKWSKISLAKVGE